MANFNIHSKADRDIRHCRTSAFGARLFAAHPRHELGAPLWENVAAAWEELAKLKELAAQNDAKLVKARAELVALLTERNQKLG